MLPSRKTNQYIISVAKLILSRNVFHLKQSVLLYVSVKLEHDPNTEAARSLSDVCWKRSAGTIE